MPSSESRYTPSAALSSGGDLLPIAESRRYRCPIATPVMQMPSPCTSASEASSRRVYGRVFLGYHGLRYIQGARKWLVPARRWPSSEWGSIVATTSSVFVMTVSLLMFRSIVLEVSVAA